MDDNKRTPDDSYKDLLDIYAREEDEQKKPELKNMVERNRKSGKKPFKLEIKDLDSEFTDAPQKRPPVRRDIPVHHSTDAPERHNAHNAHKRPPEKHKIHKRPPEKNGTAPRGISYDDEFGPIITRGGRNGGNAASFGTASYEQASEQGAVRKRPPIKGIKGNEKEIAVRIAAYFVRNKKTWITIAVCVVCAICLSSYLISCMNDVLAIRRDSENVISVTIPAETNTSDVINILKDNGLIKHKHFCKMFAKIMKYRDDNYMSGIYYITKSMGVEKMLSTFKSPPSTGETVRLSFPEGYTADQIVEKLEKYEVCSADAIYKAMREVDFSSEYTFIKNEPNKEQRYRSLEGYLYPDTYDFYKGENASSVIRTFLNNFQKKWTDDYQKKADALNMSVDDIIKLASIIEKEAADATQMPLVSSVLHNRLNKPGLYPSLQCDSTADYINDYIAKNVTNATELAAYTSRYSTYKCEGLPVGAICNPGNDSINAALNPAKTDYYFFAHDTNKKIYLAKNDSERQANNIAILQANQKAAKSASQ